MGYTIVQIVVGRGIVEKTKEEAACHLSTK